MKQNSTEGLHSITGLWPRCRVVSVTPYCVKSFQVQFLVALAGSPISKSFRVQKS